jgi:nucleoside-diphosphate-sugar epimerase
MRILIIGGTGVLSREIAVQSIAAGHQVTILTDGKGNLPEPVGLEQHIHSDRNDAVALLAAIPRSQWDLVIDSICYRSQQALELQKIITDISHHTIVVSTAVVYSPNINHSLNFDDKIATELELGKYTREKIEMEAAWLQSDHPVTILRPPHILGAGSELGIIPLHNRDLQLINRLKNHQPLFLADGGRQEMQVVYNADIAKVILAAAGNSKTFGKIYNCANPQIITGYEYFKTIADLLGVDLHVQEIPKETIWSSNWGWVITTVSRILDMTSLREDIGMVPSTPLSEALAQTISYLLSMDRNYHLPDQSLTAIEFELAAGGANLTQVLSDCIERRGRTPIDQRMNIDPPIYNQQISKSGFSTPKASITQEPWPIGL